VVSSMPQQYFTPGKDPVPNVQEAGWAPGPVWTSGKSRPTGININEYQEYFLGVKAAYHIHVPIVLKSLGAKSSWNTLSLSRPVMGLL